MASVENGATSYRGVMTQLVTPFGVLNTGQNSILTNHLYSPEKTFIAPEGISVNLYKASALPGSGSPQTTVYKLRGYYVAGSTYETYELLNSITLPPPSGHTLIDVTVVGINKI
jgi:hypothetical protein